MELWMVLLLLQGVLPLSLLAVLLFFPLRSAGAWALVLLATAALLAALRTAGLWTVPPWWGWWVYAALWFLSLVVGSARVRSRVIWPTGHGDLVAVGAAMVTLLGAGHFAFHAHAGSRPPATAIHDLSFPLQGGAFLVVNGGSDIRVNAHLKVLDEPRFRTWVGNAHGVDLVAIDTWGRRASSLLLPAQLNAYVSQGWPVLAPCSGEVIKAVDAAVELQPPRIDQNVPPSGNHVVLRCDDLHVWLAHLQRGSVRAVTGQRVATGEPLGAVGNSGRSDEPHLHIHVQRPGSEEAPLSGEPLPVTFDGQYLVRGQRIVKPARTRQETR